MRLTLVLFALFTAAIAQAQLVSVGVKGGVSTLNPTNANDESKRYLVGPSVEVSLPANFAIEVDALYQRLGTDYSYLAPFAFSTGVVQPGAIPITGYPLTLRQRGNSWEFPLLMKYYIRPVHHLRPFFSGGFSFRTIGQESSGVQILTYSNNATQTVPFKTELRTNLAVGAVGVVGLRYKVGRFSILPEFRYTRYGSDDRFANKNSANFILGISF